MALTVRLLPALAILAWMSTASAQDGPMPNCPDSFTGRQPGQSMTCACRPGLYPADASVWGTDLYTADSGVCAAARHAGLLGGDGGAVVVTAARGASSYRGSTRNGVTTQDYEEYDASFTLRAAAAAQRTAPQPCPDNFASWRGVAEPMRCLCPAEATAGGGTVWGVEVYTDDSAICRAAVHAGAIPQTGGVVTLRSLPGRDAYAGARRNGVLSSDFGPWPGSFRFEGVAADARPAAATAPVQAPVAQTLTARGQVQLYITFRTNSAELDPSAAEVLGELRAALEANPGLRLSLVGHTDSTGTAALNRPLSLRRAESVRAWLVARGIASNRLAVEGKGPDQPLADNGTDAGRALNRRVSAVRVGN